MCVLYVHLWPDRTIKSHVNNIYEVTITYTDLIDVDSIAGEPHTSKIKIKNRRVPDFLVKGHQYW